MRALLSKDRAWRKLTCHPLLVCLGFWLCRVDSCSPPSMIVRFTLHRLAKERRIDSRLSSTKAKQSKITKVYFER